MTTTPNTPAPKLVLPCPHCTGTHFGTNGRCPYLCEKCGHDIRIDALIKCACHKTEITPSTADAPEDAQGVAAKLKAMIGEQGGVQRFVEYATPFIKAYGQKRYAEAIEAALASRPTVSDFNTVDEEGMTKHNLARKYDAKERREAFNQWEEAIRALLTEKKP